MAKPSISRDRYWWGGVYGGFLLVAVLVYTAAFQMAPPGWNFSGFLLNSGDVWGYQAFVRSFAEGGWLIDNPFSDVAQEPAFFNLLWFALGQVRRLTGLPFLAIYYAFGVLAAGLMFWAILRFTREFAGGGAAGRLAFLLASIGGGLGWVVMLLPGDLATRWRPMDLFYPEGYPLQAALFMPHLALSIALLGTIMLWFFRGVTGGSRKWCVGAALLTACLSFFHPYHLVTVGIVAGAWVAVEQTLGRRRLHRGWADLGLLALAMLPAALYYRWFFRQPNWVMWGAENVLRTKGAAAVLVGLGPAAVMAGVGAWRRLRRNHDASRRLLLVWTAVGLGLLFSYPLFQFEAKLIEGLILPLAALGAGAIFGPDEVAGTRRKWLAAAALFLILLPSHGVLVSQSLRVVGGTWDNFFPADWIQGCTLTDGEVALNGYLEGHSLAGELIMLSYAAGRILPGVSDARMFISGNYVTRNFRQRLTMSRWFFIDSEQPEERLYVLREHGATLVWYRYGLGLVFDPALEPYLEPVFASGDAGLWRVRQ